MIGVSGRILSTAEIIAMKRCGIVSEVSGEGTLRDDHLQWLRIGGPKRLTFYGQT